MYLLLDANVAAGYYLPRSLKSKIARNRIEMIFDSVRSGQRNDFFYLPNFCVAEVFSVLMKHSFGTWNKQVKKTINTKHYNRIVAQFQEDIHNGKFIYHYELSRYHVLGMNLVAPIDHYFQIARSRKSTSKKLSKQGKKVGPNVTPMGTFDHLIISMGIHLAHVHGNANVAVVSTDERLTNVLAKCKSSISANTIRRLKLDKAETLTGRSFSSNVFPKHLNLKSCTQSDLKDVFGEWPLDVGKVPKVGRYTVL